jgi:glycerol-3-phosphate acyltransferase PlsY
MTEALILIFSFFIGSIPIGFLVAKSRGIDIRKEGSGNIGATNVLRVLGKGPGIAVFVADILKGLIPSVIALNLMGSKEWAFGAGMTAVLGHTFSPFLKFKGGKGIATGLGMLLGSSTVVGLGAFGLFCLVMAATMMVSASSVVAGLSLPLIGIALGHPPGAMFFYVLMMLVVVIRHIPNIKRIKEGTEPVLGQVSGQPRPMDLKKKRLIALFLGIDFVILSLVANWVSNR